MRSTVCASRNSKRIATVKQLGSSNIFEARTRLFEYYADNHFMTVYGEPTPQLLGLVKAAHMEGQFKWFSFVRGLD
jgi:hypothetical protein